MKVNIPGCSPAEFVVIPKQAWDGFAALVNVKLGKPTNRDKSPSEILEMARAVLEITGDRQK